uniref:Uncharacterized protein n=1 Tax=Amorphochlora amoebiformis TaxID=1561963 RepID=A0A7S0DW90_9EUKA|mmetsp:Transcript_9106/g.14405  ORF Transcript_9106/g.14405 Transcript_9106/m.14405 type:complete len:335 (+) Transcript_9106:502-1506(+)
MGHGLSGEFVHPSQANLSFSPQLTIFELSTAPTKKLTTYLTEHFLRKHRPCPLMPGLADPLMVYEEIKKRGKVNALKIEMRHSALARIQISLCEATLSIFPNLTKCNFQMIVRSKSSVLLDKLRKLFSSPKIAQRWLEHFMGFMHISVISRYFLVEKVDKKGKRKSSRISESSESMVPAGRSVAVVKKSPVSTYAESDTMNGISVMPRSKTFDKSRGTGTGSSSIRKHNTTPDANAQMQSGWSRSIITSSRIRSFSRSRSPKKRQLTSPSELRTKSPMGISDIQNKDSGSEMKQLIESLEAKHRMLAIRLRSIEMKMEGVDNEAANSLMQSVSL